MRAGDEGSPAPALSPAQRAAADAGAKGLMPVGGRPLLDHVLEALHAGGVRDVVFVVAPDETALRSRYLREAPPAGLIVRFAEQAEPRGTADALLAARNAVVGREDRLNAESASSADFLMLNADNLYPVESIAALVALGEPGLIAYDADALVEHSNIDRERVRQFALLDLALDDTLRDIVEKPDADHPLVTNAANGRWVSMNLWRFPQSIFDDCAAVKPSVRGELELADAVRHAIRVRGVRFRAVRQRLGVLDLSRRADVAVVDALLIRNAGTAAASRTASTD